MVATMVVLWVARMVGPTAFLLDECSVAQLVGWTGGQWVDQLAGPMAVQKGTRRAVPSDVRRVWTWVTGWVLG